jgi:hypothetical protein
MQNTFTIPEIRKYILSQDSLGDVLYNLSASKIIEANEEEEEEDDEDEEDDARRKFRMLKKNTTSIT